MAGPAKSRRGFLRLGTTLATAGIAGCFGGSDSENTSTQTSESETPTQTWARARHTESDVGTEPPSRTEKRTSTRSRTTTTDESLWDEPLSCEGAGQSIPVDIPRVTDQTTNGELPLTIPNAWLAEAVINRKGFSTVLTGDDSQFPDEDSQAQYLTMEVDGIDVNALGVTLTYSPEPYAVMREVDVDFHRSIQTKRPEGPTIIGIPIPATPLSDVSVHFGTPDGTATWNVPARLHDHFTSAPDFSLLDATISTPCEEARLVVTVSNTGDRDGIWRGLTAPEALHDGSDPIRINVPADTAVRKAVDLMTSSQTGKVSSIDEERRFIRWT